MSSSASSPDIPRPGASATATAGDGRLRARAADLQRQADGLPARPRADGHAHLRRVHGRACVRVDAAFGLPRRDVTVPADWLAPDWPIAGVGALMTTRTGGVSEGPYASMNVGLAVGDDPAASPPTGGASPRRWAPRPSFCARCTARASFASAPTTRARAPPSTRPTPRSRRWRASPAPSRPPTACRCCSRRRTGAPWLRRTPAGAALPRGVVEATVGALCSAAGCAPAELVGLARCLHRRRCVRGRCRCGRRVRRRPPTTARCHARRRVVSGPRRRASGSPICRAWRATASSMAGVVRVDGGRWCTVTDRARFFSYRARRHGRQDGRRDLDQRRGLAQARIIGAWPRAKRAVSGRRPCRRAPTHSAQPTTVRERRAATWAMSGNRSPALNLPTDALAEAQRDYLIEATAIWNRLLVPGSAPRPSLERPTLREPRLGTQSVGGVPRRDVPAQRAHAAQARHERPGRSEDAGARALRRAAVDRRGIAEQLPRTQSGSANEGDRDQGREPDARADAPLGRHPARSSLAERRERVRGRPQRRDDGRMR